MSEDVRGELSVATTDDPRPRLPDGEPTPGMVEAPPGPVRPPWAGRATPPAAVDAGPAVAVGAAPAVVEVVDPLLESGLEVPTIPVDWPAPVAPAAAEPVDWPAPEAPAGAETVDWPAPVVAAEPAAAAAETPTALAAQEDPVPQPVADDEPATPALVEEDADDELILGAVALALGEASSESPEPSEAEAPRPDLEEPVAGAAAMVDASPTALTSSPELPGVGMVPQVAAAVAPPPDVVVEAPPAPTILPAAMVAMPAPAPPPAPPPDDLPESDNAADAGDDELLELWAIADDDKAKVDAEPRLRRRVIGTAAGRWSAMRRGERVNFVLYALTGVSIVAMTLELLAGPDAIPTDVATTPGGSASQTVPAVKSTTTVTFTLPQDTEPPPVVTRPPSRVTAPPAGDEEPASDPPADEEEEPDPTPTTQAPATTAPTIPRTTPTTFSNTFPTPVPPVPPTFVGPPVATTAPRIPAP